MSDSLLVPWSKPKARQFSLKNRRKVHYFVRTLMNYVDFGS
jgi:hypothetical protein